MLHTLRFRWLWPALSLLLLAGCAGKEEEQPEEQGAQVRTTPERQPESPATTPPAAPPAETAEAAARIMANAITQARLQDFWSQLPPAYQQDVNALVRQFAAKMDPELWNRIFGTLQKLTVVLLQKRDFILGTPLVKTWIQKQTTSEEQLKSEWNDVIKTLDVIVRSDLSDQQKLRDFDTGVFLAGPGNEVLKQIDKLTRLAGQPSPFDQFRGTKITTLSAEQNQATIQVTRLGQEPEQIEYIQIEGHWVPRTWADGWAEFVMTTRQRIDSVQPEQVAQTKAQIIPQLDQLDAILNQFLATKNQAEFDQVFQTQGPVLTGMVMAAAARSGTNPATPTERPAKDLVLLKFDQALPQPLVDQLFAPLTKITADPDKAQVFPLEESGKTVIEVAPVTDINAFVEKLRAILAGQKAGRIVDVNPEELTITIKAPE